MNMNEKDKQFIEMFKNQIFYLIEEHVMNSNRSIRNMNNLIHDTNTLIRNTKKWHSIYSFITIVNILALFAHLYFR